MNKRNSAYVIIGILVVMLLLYWLTGASKPDILGWGLVALCAYLLSDTLYSAYRQRPEGFRKKFQILLSVIGNVALIAVLLYFLLIKGFGGTP